MRSAIPLSIRKRPTVYGTLVALVFLLFICRGVVWGVLTPPWQAPDEPSHASYSDAVRVDGPLVELVRGSRGLVQSADASEFNLIAHNPSYPGTLAEGGLMRERARFRDIEDSDLAELDGISSSAGGYPPGYYLVTAALHRTVRATGGDYLSVILGTRWLSVSLAVLALVAQYLLIRELFGRSFETVVGIALIALMPMYAFTTAGINPDNAIIMLVSIATYIALRIVTQGISAARVLGLVGCCILAMLTKQTGLILLPLLGVIVAKASRSDGEREFSWRRALVTTTAVLAAVGLPLFGYRIADSSPNAVSGIASAASNSASIGSLMSYAGVLNANWHGMYFNSFWGNFGWLDTSFEVRAYDQFIVVGAIAAVGLLHLMANARRVAWPWVVTATPLVVLLALLVVVEFTSIQSGAGVLIQGRYFFPVMGPIVALFILGLTRPFEREWFRRSVLTGAVVALLLFHVAAIVNLVMPRYSL